MKFLILLIALPMQALDLTLPELSQEDIIDIPERKFLQFVEIKEPPSRAQIITYWTLNVLDVYTTYEGLKNPNTKEANPFLGERPHLDNLLIHKLVFAGLAGQNLDTYGYTWMNFALTGTVIRNHHLNNTTSWCPNNIHVDGHRMPC
tara:strand:+ start:1056 stop:1496 length:441 start_codon:yes stop_codon:yes gene_type:complete